MEWSIVSAVNDEEVLHSSLLRSPDLRKGVRVLVQKGYSSAAAAYNDALKEVKTDLIMFIHQDMYLPAGWLGQAERALALLEAQDPNWGVVGVWGVTRSGNAAGYLYWTGIGQPRGDIFEGTAEVETLDEVILIVRKSSGLHFDPKLPGFHMYGPDLCLQAQDQGKRCYAISALCVHNTNTYSLLPRQFWQAYFYMRRKWSSQLPIHTTCTVITRWCWPVMKWNAVRMANILLGRHQTFQRVAEPARLYEQLRDRQSREMASPADSLNAMNQNCFAKSKTNSL